MKGAKEFIVFSLMPVIVGSEARYIPHSPNSLHRKHWGARMRWKKAWELEVYHSFLEQCQRLKKAGVVLPKFPFSVAEARIVLHTTSPMDYDNSVASLKGVIDGIRYSKIILDDNPENLTINVSTKKVKEVKEQKVQITIRAL